MKLAIVRHNFLNRWDMMTFAPLADMGFELYALGTSSNVYGQVGDIGVPFKTIRYSDIRKVDWSNFDIIDTAEVFHDWTAHICKVVGPKTFVTCWDLFKSKAPHSDIPAVVDKAKHFIARSPKTIKMLPQPTGMRTIMIGVWHFCLGN